MQISENISYLFNKLNHQCEMSPVDVIFPEIEKLILFLLPNLIFFFCETHIYILQLIVNFNTLEQLLQANKASQLLMSKLISTTETIYDILQ